VLRLRETNYFPSLMLRHSAMFWRRLVMTSGVRWPPLSMRWCSV